MTDRGFDAIDQRFEVIRQIEVPDTWSRIVNGSGSLRPPGQRVKRALIAGVAACLAVLVAGVIATLATRGVPEPARPADESAEPTMVCSSSTCVPAHWDPVGTDLRQLNIVYYVDAGCPGAFAGTQVVEHERSVRVDVFLETSDASGCTGDAVQRSTSVVLETELAGRNLTGCRNPDAVFAAAPVASCAEAITPTYQGTERMRSEMAQLSNAPPTTVAGELWLAPIETETVDIVEPGTYELLAEIDPDRIADCSGLVIPGELDEFIDFRIEPPTESSTGLFEQRVVGSTTYLVIEMIVTTSPNRPETSPSGSAELSTARAT